MRIQHANFSSGLNLLPLKQTPDVNDPDVVTLSLRAPFDCVLIGFLSPHLVTLVKLDGRPSHHYRHSFLAGTVTLSTDEYISLVAGVRHGNPEHPTDCRCHAKPTVGSFLLVDCLACITHRGPA